MFEQCDKYAKTPAIDREGISSIVKEDELLNIFNQKLFSSDETIIEFTQEIIHSSTKVRNKIIKNIMKALYNNLNLRLCFVVLYEIYNKRKDDTCRFFIRENFKADLEIYLSILIEKYTIFIQEYFQTEAIDLLELLDSIIQDPMSYEEKERYILSGIFPLLLTYFNICKVNQPVAISLISKFSQNSSMTIVNLLEKVHFVFNDLPQELDSLNHISQYDCKILKQKFQGMLSSLHFSFLKHNYSLFSVQEILSIFMKYPLIQRNKNTIKDSIEFIYQLLQSAIIDWNIFDKIVACLLNFLEMKKAIRSAFLYSICLSQLPMRDYSSEIFIEFGFICLSCGMMKVCFSCVHRCHYTHTVRSLGYSMFACECGTSSLCNSVQNLEMPSHIKKSFVGSTSMENKSASENANPKLSSLVNQQHDSITYLDNQSFNKSDKIQECIFLSTECNTKTLETKLPICKVGEDLRNNNELLFDFFEDDTLFYFEVEIIMGGYFDQIAVGVTSDQNYPEHEFAGYLEGSVGYHGDDGKCCVNAVSYTYGAKYGSKDIIGCGVTGNGNVYFTHNGCILPLIDIKLKGKIYALITLRGKYSSAKICQVGNFLFIHEKQKLYKNPLSGEIEYSNRVAQDILANEELIKLLNASKNNFKSNDNKIKRLWAILHNACEKDKRKKNLLKSFKEESGTSRQNHNREYILNCMSSPIKEIEENERCQKSSNNNIQVNGNVEYLQEKIIQYPQVGTGASINKSNTQNPSPNSYNEQTKLDLPKQTISQSTVVNTNAQLQDTCTCRSGSSKCIMF